VRKPPANQQLRRAQYVLALAVLVPVVLMVGIGVLLLVTDSSPATIVLSILILGLSASGITGYILGTVFVGKAANLAKLQNEFVGAVSHELRTPITSIRLLMESLSTGKLDADDQANVVTLLARETARLEVLVGRVLELSRLQMSHVFRRHRLDVASLVEEAVHAFDALTLTNPTKITVTIEPGLTVTGDRGTLVRALVNLLTNAWKYTGDDKQIAIEAGTVKRRIEIRVHDNGPGIPRDEQRALFEAFRRGRDALKSGAPGVGLGLSFVQAIVRGHGGKLDVQSRPGETVFRIRLKKRRETASVAEPKRVPELASS
jgi:two-component system, OmpR family, phosphate regulon sensor histidine kinase PhoR